MTMSRVKQRRPIELGQTDGHLLIDVRNRTNNTTHTEWFAQNSGTYICHKISECVMIK